MSWRNWLFVGAGLLLAQSAAAQGVYTVEDAGRDSLAINDQYFARVMNSSAAAFQKPGWVYSEFLLPDPRDNFALALDFAMNIPVLELELPLFGIMRAGWLFGAQVFTLPRESPAAAALRVGKTLDSDFLSDGGDSQNGLSGYTGFDFYNERGDYLRLGINASTEFEAVSSTVRPYIFTNFGPVENVTSFLDVGFNFSGGTPITRFGSGVGYRLRGLLPGLAGGRGDLEPTFVYTTYRRLLAYQHNMSLITSWFLSPDPSLEAGGDETAIKLQLGRYFPVYEGESFGESFSDSDWLFRVDAIMGGPLKIIVSVSHMPEFNWGWRLATEGKMGGVSIQSDYMLDSNYGRPIPGTTFYVYLSYPAFGAEDT